MNIEMGIHKRMFLSFLAIVILIGIDVFGYMVIVPGIDIGDALYMTIISITTVGYGEVFPLSDSARLFTIWVIISGLGLFFYFIQHLLKESLELNIRTILGRRKMKKLEKNKGHIIIAGFGLMGEQICRSLCQAKSNFIIIEKDRERFELGESLNYKIIHGDATNEEILNAANTSKAKVFLSLLSSDMDNIYTVMAVREVHPDITIMTRSQEEINRKRLHKVGADRVISPYDLGSRRLVNSILRPNLVEFIDLMTYTPNISLSIEEYYIEEDSEFCNKKILDSGLRENYLLIIVGIKREGDMIFNPLADEVIKFKDILILLGESQNLLKLPK